MDHYSYDMEGISDKKHFVAFVESVADVDITIFEMVEKSVPSYGKNDF